ncbi:molybdopterin-synthase adenylyltransferase MoeB [Marinicauda algicola]|uniref:Molybdopterin-synthase adenylyltransferase MoeB n=1 Tax=Marinicauda algicola TaxID=2029849 RepID=A0A4S2H150_9PROT|nr:molybdopterin-synthase adenylyltransferase MoeB [Marinicauda algicola]TGY89164.1 molybdopterin-synthase adenylyltransferase MoeB [Marinicauda algicola]
MNRGRPAIAIDTQRHARHILLKEIGGPGQQRLSKASVLLVGAGGLGSPAALYLAAAGIGRLRIVDPDTVSLDNLQRQILYRTGDVGAPKAAKAAEALTGLDPAVRVEPVEGRADAGTLPGFLDGMDLVLDGCDDFATRFAVNDAAVKARVPLVSGAVGRWSGQLGVFAPHLGADLPCYRCLVPEIPPGAERCAEVGIVGALTGAIGSLMALEAIKLIARAGTPLLGRLHIQDTLKAEARVVRVAKDPACPVCAGP